jgi:hypothetical protein
MLVISVFLPNRRNGAQRHHRTEFIAALHYFRRSVAAILLAMVA